MKLHNMIKKVIPSHKTKFYLHRISYKSENNTRIFLLLSICLLSWAGMLLLHSNAKAGDLQEGIAKEIIRFHVIANSDSPEDQQLKLRVKDTLVKELSPLFKDSANIEESRAIIQSNLSRIATTATEIIHQYGYSYSVTVSLEPSYFPMKVYGDYTFPPGTYEALRVKIGDASGQNWWCVMFPPLCFVDETYSIVDIETEGQLEQLLTEEELDALKDHSVPVKYKSKLWESIKRLFH